MDKVKITAHKVGPYVIKGPFEIIDAEGKDVTPNKEQVSICACGKSHSKPFCDGSHLK